jgi:hypothetical protein
MSLRVFLMSVVFVTVPGIFSTAAEIDLTAATVVIRSGDLPAGEKIAPVILTEEIASRTDLAWNITPEWPSQAAAIISISTVANPPAWWRDEMASGISLPSQPESYVIHTTVGVQGGPSRVTVIGADGRGAMYGVGKLLRNLNWRQGRVTLDTDFHAAESPSRPLRGHQIGYRNTANSWDAWTYEQLDQYFREMAIFGANAIENIPWEGGGQSPVMQYDRDEVNLRYGDFCEKYDLDQWIWAPVLFNLPDAAEEEAFLKKQEAFYRRTRRLNAVFVPGGDPGSNKANALFPYLERMGALLATHHPRAKIWLSMQGFKADDVEFVYMYLQQKKPVWFGGLVMGPSSPPMEPTRKRLPSQYQLRWYPDVTHCVRCQYPVPWYDPALGITLGREPVNPRPVDYTQIYRMDYRFTDGFLTYSDGVHDDFNKSLWSQLGWNPDRSARDVAIEYCRFFFHPDVAETAADGLFALETNMKGALAENGSITATYELWKQLEQTAQVPKNGWRFRMHVFRAYYDAYTRARLLHETEIEQRALGQLANAAQTGVAASIQRARATLNEATSHNASPELAERLTLMAEELFQEIGLQTSVPKYKASGYERGAVMDYVDAPLNNRVWLEQQFDKIAALPDSTAQLQQLETIRNWENPGEGGYYDVIGHVGRSPRVIKLLNAGDVMRNYQQFPIPTQKWVEEKHSSLRMAWHSYLSRVPQGITYNDLDPAAVYTIRLFAQRESPLMVDGARIKLLKKGDTWGEVTEQFFEVPATAVQDGTITVTWEKLDESYLNWRGRHYVTDIWLTKTAAK